MPEICQATPAPRVITTKCVVDEGVCSFDSKRRCGSRLPSRLPPSDRVCRLRIPRPEARRKVSENTVPRKFRYSETRCGSRSSAFGAQVALPSSAHRRLTWNAEAAVAAGRAPGSERGSVAYHEKTRSGTTRLRFLPPNGAAARDVLRFCPPRIPHPAPGHKSGVICGIFRSLPADNNLTGAMAHEAGAVGGARVEVVRSVLGVFFCVYKKGRRQF